MPSTTVDLGHLAFSNSKANLDLQGCVQISINLPDDIQANYRDQSSLVELLSSGSVWVCRGSGFHLTLDFHVDEEIVDQTQYSQLLPALAKAVCDAEVCFVNAGWIERCLINSP